MEVLGFTSSIRNTMWKILAGILHLGNVTFKEEVAAKTGQIAVSVANPAGTKWFARAHASFLKQIGMRQELSHSNLLEKTCMQSHNEKFIVND